MYSLGHTTISGTRPTFPSRRAKISCKQWPARKHKKVKKPWSNKSNLDSQTKVGGGSPPTTLPWLRNTRSSASKEIGIPVDFSSSTKASLRVGGNTALLFRMGCNKKHCAFEVFCQSKCNKSNKDYTYCCKSFMLQIGSKRTFHPIFQTRDDHTT